MAFLAGKRILITGLLSNRSIAWGIAKACAREGAQLAFTYQNERFKDRVTEMAAELGSQQVYVCDVASDEDIAALFTLIGADQTPPVFDFKRIIAYPEPFAGGPQPDLYKAVIAEMPRRLRYWLLLVMQEGVLRLAARRCGSSFSLRAP